MVALVKKHTQLGEDYPELLPTVAVLELAKQVPARLILKQNADVKGKVSR